MMRHGPGLAASPLVRNNLEVGGEEHYSSYVFSAVGGQSLSEAASGASALLEQRSSVQPILSTASACSTRRILHAWT